MQRNTSQPKNEIKPSGSIKQVKSLNTILRKIDSLYGEGEGWREKLTDLAQLLIPGLADWCCVHILNADNTLDCMAFVPAEVVNSQAVYDWLQNDLPNDESDGIPAVIKSGTAKVVAQVNPIRRAAEAGIQSYLILPLITSQRTLGSLTLIFSESGRYYDTRFVHFAENVALHVAVYLDKYFLQNGRKPVIDETKLETEGDSVELSEAIAQLKQSEGIIQTIFRVSNKLNATLDVELILDTLAQEAIEIVNGESGYAGLRTPGGMSVHKYFQDGVSIPFEHTWQLGEGIPGWVLKYKVPYGTSDADNDQLIQRELVINTNVRSIICTPILDTVGEVIAYFDIRNKKGEEGFSINDQELLLTLAPVASIAIQNALTYQQLQSTVSELKETTKQLQELAASQDSAREEERLRVSRELHDELGQTLTSLKYDLSSLADQLEKTDDTLAQKTKDISSQVNMLIKTVRRIAKEMRPGMVDDLGLVASIEWQGHEFEKHSGAECEFSLPSEEPALTRDQSLTLFRIFQEALTNVAAHANAKHIKVSLEPKGEWLSLRIQDDGQGITQEEIISLHSLGLIGMRERAKHLEGTFEIKGVPNLGTTVTVNIPFKK